LRQFRPQTGEFRKRQVAVLVGIVLGPASRMSRIDFRLGKLLVPVGIDNAVEMAAHIMEVDLHRHRFVMSHLVAVMGGAVGMTHTDDGADTDESGNAGADMKFLPKSLSGQLVLILLLTLLVAQGVTLFLFVGERREAIPDIYRQNVVARTVSLVGLLEDTPVALHSRVVAAASSGPLRFELLSAAPSIRAENTGERGQFLKSTLAAALDIPMERVVVEKRNSKFWRRHHHRDDDDDDEEHHRRKGHRWYAKWVTLGVRLPDGQWLSVTAGPPPGAPRWGKWFLVSLILSGLAIAGVAVMAGRRVAKPMRELADAAGRLGRGEPVGDVAEAGPRETRETIRAFNLMHDRLERYLRDRMAMLAAISHDLKTPITSLRLRAEFIEDEEMHSKILATLDEMQAMTESTLDFIREDAARDPGRVTDVA
jgi:HAMP domain-containing protein